MRLLMCCTYAAPESRFRCSIPIEANMMSAISRPVSLSRVSLGGAALESRGAPQVALPHGLRGARTCALRDDSGGREGVRLPPERRAACVDCDEGASHRTDRKSRLRQHADVLGKPSASRRPAQASTPRDRKVLRLRSLASPIVGLLVWLLLRPEADPDSPGNPGARRDSRRVTFTVAEMAIRGTGLRRPPRAAPCIQWSTRCSHSRQD